MVSNDKSINVVCNINEAYVQHCGVMLCSLFMNNKNEHFIVHILHFSITEKSQSVLADFVKSFGNEIYFYKVKQLGFDLPNLKSHYISAEAYLRLLITRYVPNDIDKILYLDVDMIVLGCIRELFSTNLDGVLLGAIQDSPNPVRQERLDIPKENGYFNAGVMLLNLAYWRAQHITEKSIAFIKDHPEKIRQHDQDVLNVVSEGHWRRISFKWNMLNTFFFRHPVVDSQFLNELEENKRDARIAHFSGGVKPWMAWEKHPYHKEYYRYLEYTPWKGYKPSLRTQWKAYKFPRNILAILGIDKLFNTFNLLDICG